MKFSIATISSALLVAAGADATPSLRRALNPAASVDCATCTDCVVDDQGYAFRLQSYVNVTGTMGDPGTYTYTYAYGKCSNAVKNDLSHWDVWIASTCNDVTDVSCTGNLGSLVPASSDGSCLEKPYTGKVGKCDTPQEGDQYGTISFTVTNVIDPDGGAAFPQSKPGNTCSAGLNDTLVGPTCGPGGVVNVCGDGNIVSEETCEKSGTDAVVYMNIVDPSTLGSTVVENCRPDTCTYCGDGIVNGPETCDGSPPAGVTDADGNPVACNTDCGYCGDGFTNGGEECDGGDDCNPDCTLTSTPVCDCTEAPVLITPIGDREVECGSGLSLDFASYAQFQVCGENKYGVPVQTTKLPDASAACPAGSKTMQWSVTDCNGITATATQTITLKDSTPPELPRFDTIDMLECGVDELQRPVVEASDKCDTALADPILTTDDTSNFNGKIGTIVDTWTATDGCGNSDTTTKTYEFVDTQPPAISGTPTDQKLYCTSTLPDASSIRATDVCVGDVTVSEETTTNTRGATCDNVGLVSRTWTAIDGHGNTATATQTTEFIDDVAPVIWGVPSIVQSYQCGAANLPTFESVVATDVCGNKGLSLTSTETSVLDVIPGEERTVTWTATDCSGNEATASYTYQILDRCDFVVSESFSGVSMDVTVEVESVESTAGSGTFDVLKMTVTVTDSDYIGDIRGVFFHVTDAAAITDVKVDGKSTNYVVGNDDVDKVANDVLMKGGGKNTAHKYDVGVEVGTRGKSKDDYQSVTIIVEGINASDFDESNEVGIRLTSVGMADGSREQSSKIFLDAPTCCRAGESNTV